MRTLCSVKQARHERTNPVGFHLNEVPEETDLWRQKVLEGVQGAGGGGKGELVFNGDRAAFR